MSDREYFLEQAARCRRWAAVLPYEELATELLALADHLERLAERPASEEKQ